jgi:hypothetical protein
MAPLVRIVSLQLMDRRRLRAPHDIERHRLVGVAAEATDFEIEVARVERVTQGQ